ncbi:MAG: hypothetical protein V1696_03795 [Candidatus Jorgensenbacteria bacterium]
MDFIRYSFWPMVKVRLLYWWWIVKYGGEKNIPKELLFKKMAESMSRLAENLEAARRAMSPDADQEETKTLIDIMRKVGSLKENVEEAKRDSLKSPASE